jgi:hypothetical protein
LLKAGADTMVRDGDGKLPAELAKAAGHEELSKLLAPPVKPGTINRPKRAKG